MSDVDLQAAFLSNLRGNSPLYVGGAVLYRDLLPLRLGLERRFETTGAPRLIPPRQ